MSIDLAFNTAMARGTGTIFVTDGAVQTVIDRVTGQPVMRIVGATVTREIAASDVTIDGTHVRFDVSGLQGSHGYSVVMDPGVLVTAANKPFAGLRTPGQVAFTAPAALSVAKVELDGSMLSAGHNLGVTITFSQAVADLDPAAITTPGARLAGGLQKVGDGTAWHLTLAGAEPTNAAANAIGINMAMVRDLAGNPGSGIFTSATYAVDTVAPTATVSLDGDALQSDNSIGVTIIFSEAVAEPSHTAIQVPDATLGPLTSDDGGITWKGTLTAAGGSSSTGNRVSIDMSKVFDLHGNAGSGSASSATSYAVDTLVKAVLEPQIQIDDLGADRTDYVTADAERHLSGNFTGLLLPGQHIKLAIDDVEVDSEDIHTEVNGETSVNGWYYQGSGDFTDGVHNVTAWIEDASGKSDPVVSQLITIDTHKPTFTSSAGTSTPFDVTSALVITFSEPVYWDSHGADHQLIRLANVSDNSASEIYVDERNLSSDRRTLTINADDLHLLGDKDYRVTLPTELIDLAGNEVGENEISFRTLGAYVDSSAPRALRAEATVVSDWHGGSYGAGTVIDIHVRFSEQVQLVTGPAPVLGLDNGALATFSSISADNLELTFRYTVGASTSDTTHLEITDNSQMVGRIADLAGNVLTSADIDFAGLGSAIAIDTHAPAAVTTALLSRDHDTGSSDTDNITNERTPLLEGTGAEPGAYLKIYEGSREVGHGSANDDGSWCATVGTDNALSDGVHTLVVKQVDRAGNEGAASPAVVVAIDTTGPAAIGNHEGPNAGDFSVLFSEAITLTPGASLRVLDSLGQVVSTLLGQAPDWKLVNDDSGAASILRFHADSLLPGSYRLQLGSEAIHDLAGNAAIIGQPEFEFHIPGIFG